jgi:hypothetical protein
MSEPGNRPPGGSGFVDEKTPVLTRPQPENAVSSWNGQNLVALMAGIDTSKSSGQNGNEVGKLLF